MIEVMQVQELLAHSEIINVSFDSLEIMYNNEIYTIEQDKNRLVKRVGYQILMHDIDEIQFWFEDEVLLMHVVYQEEEYEFGIYKKEWWRD